MFASRKFKKLVSKPWAIVWLAIVLLMSAACSSAPTPSSAPTLPPTPLPTSTPVAEVEAPEPASQTDEETNANAEAAAEVTAAEKATQSSHRTFMLVPAESNASYLVDEEFFAGAFDKLGIKAGLSEVIGTTQEIEGQFQINLADLAAPLGVNKFTVNLATLTTDQNRRDKWIRENGPQFNTYPLAEFTANAVEGSPESYTAGDEVQFRLNGDMTIHEVTQPVTFDVTAKLQGDTITGVASTRLLMSSFGIEPPSFANTLTVQDEFGIEVVFTAREQ